MEIKIIEIEKIKDTEPKREHGNIEELKASIKELGLINPLTINQNFKLLAGRRRYQALKELNIEKVPVRILKSENELFDFRVSLIENLQRKNLSDPEIALAIKEYDEMKRKIEGEPKPGYRTDLKGPLPHGSEGWTQEKTAEDLNISQQTVSKAIQIANAIEEYPELAKKKKGNVIIREYKRIKDEEEIKNKKFPVIEGKYKTILIDPPWDYELNLDGRAKPEYATMDLEKLKEMHIEKYAEENCHLYIWSTNNNIPLALELGSYWGFSYKTLITWIKPSFGMGSYFRNSTEQLLFFVKGKLPTRTKDIKTHFEAPRGKHSEKPEYSYQLIEEASYPAYLEIFGRKEREGWNVWGNF